MRAEYIIFTVLLTVSWLGCSYAANATEEASAKNLNLFNVIKFNNDICAGDSSKNGTCYTADECTEKGGTTSGTCASGYGVCCIISLSCGGSSSENCTYIEQSAFSNPSELSSNPCNYKLCKLTADICRIRLDFTTHVLTPPVEGTAVVGGATDSTSTYALGHCTDDTFTYSSPSKNGSPVICGYNSGQHMILDASESCNLLSFSIGSTTTTSRQWNIKVTQYNCGDDMAGPSGCLQYFYGDSGEIATFNYGTNSATTVLTATHLANQLYTVCIRRSSGKCRICYTPKIDDPTADADTAPQASFGVSLSGNAASKTVVDSYCSSDYISIPNGVANTVTDAAMIGTNRQCGRFFSPAQDDVDSATVCSLQIPFRFSVNFDGTETLGPGTSTMADLGELSEVPSGTQGFWLEYFQTNC